MPAEINLCGDQNKNEELYWYRLFFFWGAVETKSFRALPEPASLSDLAGEARSREYLIRDFLQTQFPTFRNRFPQEAPPGFLLELPLNSKVGSLADSSSPTDRCEIKNKPPGQDRQVKTIANPKIITMNKPNDNPLSHVFEKVLTADNYQAGSKAVDDSNELNEHGEALDELTLDSMTRCLGETRAFLKSDSIVESGLVVEKGSQEFFTQMMPEWFYEDQNYRPNWCRLRESVYPETKSPVSRLPRLPHHSDLANYCRNRLQQVFNSSLWMKRQMDGSEIDMDAVIHWYPQKEGHIDQRIFCHRRRLTRQTAFLILMDTSLSTDSWVSDTRVLDELKNLMEILSEAFDEYSDRFAVATFCSETRHDCLFRWLKTFDEPGRLLHQRLLFVRPEGYTRMGAALRFAQESLLAQNVKRRALVFLSDGKPIDFDHYEGSHGCHDVQRAIQEMRESEIRFHSVVLSDKKSDQYAKLFGNSGYELGTTSHTLVKPLMDYFVETLR
jgi:nitric oxide reductase NorD protein